MSPVGRTHRIPSPGARAEAQVVVPVVRLVPVPIRGTQVLGVVVPRTATIDAFRAIRFVSRPKLKC